MAWHGAGHSNKEKPIQCDLVSFGQWAKLFRHFKTWHGFVCWHWLCPYWGTTESIVKMYTQFIISLQLALCIKCKNSPILCSQIHNVFLATGINMNKRFRVFSPGNLSPYMLSPKVPAEQENKMVKNLKSKNISRSIIPWKSKLMLHSDCLFILIKTWTHWL